MAVAVADTPTSKQQEKRQKLTLVGSSETFILIGHTALLGDFLEIFLSSIVVTSSSQVLLLNMLSQTDKLFR